jgi:hypothetical protein
MCGGVHVDTVAEDGVVVAVKGGLADVQAMAVPESRLGLPLLGAVVKGQLQGDVFICQPEAGCFSPCTRSACSARRDPFASPCIKAIIDRPKQAVNIAATCAALKDYLLS